MHLDLLALSGYTRQTLRYMRLGQKQDIYEYPALLVKGKDWDKIGSAVVYTPQGKKKILQRKGREGQVTEPPQHPNCHSFRRFSLPVSTPTCRVTSSPWSKKTSMTRQPASIS